MKVVIKQSACFSNIKIKGSVEFMVILTVLCCVNKLVDGLWPNLYFSAGHKYVHKTQLLIYTEILILSDYLPKGQTFKAVLLISADAVEGHFEGEMPREIRQGVLVLTCQCLGSPGSCNPEETRLPGLALSCSPTLCSECGPVRLPPGPFAIFLPTQRSLLLWRPGWTDNLSNFS
jgi:hypothetical protein